LQPEGGNLAIVDKSYLLNERDEKGNLKPVTVEIEHGKEVIITPFTFSDIIEIGKYPEKQYEIISKHLVEPKLTAKEIEEGKPFLLTMVLTKLNEVSSGVSFRENRKV